MSKTCVVMVDVLEEEVENTVVDIENQLSKNGKVELVLSDSGTKLSVDKNFILSYYSAD